MKPGWRRLFRNTFADDAERRAVDEEMAFHLEEIERELVARGVPPERARVEARNRFGEVRRWREATLAGSAIRERATRRRSAMAALRDDLASALRQLGRRASSTSVGLGIMILGVASGTVVFAIMDPILFEPLPFADSDRVVAVTGANERSPNFWLSDFTYQRLAEGQRSFSALAPTREVRVTLLDPFPDEVGGLRVGSEFFQVLDVHPSLGRGFTAADDAPDAPQVAVITHDFWRGRFGADPDILGRRLRLSTGPAVVVGVMPEGFRWETDEFDEQRPEGNERRIFLNGVMGSTSPEVAAFGRIMPVARLAEGVDVESADGDMDRLFGDLLAAYPEAYSGEDTGWGPTSARVWSIRDRLLWLVEDQVWLLAPAILLLLVLVSLNAGSLVLVGVLDRRGELAVRASLGAGRGRLTVQILLETGLLWLLALVSGVALASAALPWVRTLVPDQIPMADLIAIDLRIVSGAVALTGVLWLSSALPPLLSGARIDLLSLLKLGGWSASRPRARTQQTLIALQMALACALAGGAGILLRSYAALLEVPPGATAEDVVVLGLRPPIELFNRPTVTVADLGGPWPGVDEWLTAEDRLYGPGRRLDALVRETLDGLREVPGVRSAAFSNMPPFWSSQAWRGVLAPGQSYDTPRSERLVSRVKWVSPGYFETVGIPILRGRRLLDVDNVDAARVVVVNQAFAAGFMPGVSHPLGETVSLDVSAFLPEEEWTVVGIVPDVLHYGPHEAREPTVYLPLAQLPPHWTRDQVGWTRVMWFLVAYDGESSALQPGLREAVWATLPDVPIRTETTMGALRRGLTARSRFFSSLLGTFAGIALLLATAGLMAMLAQQVRYRTREYGLRKALGASIPDVLRRTVRQGAGLAAAGIVLGTALAWLLARLLAASVPGVEGWSVPTQVVVAILLFVASVLASLGPALRAARVDPVVSLSAD